MKRFVLFWVLIFISLQAYGAEILNVYNWAGYLPQDVLNQFQQETGIQVNYSTFDSNETLYAKLKASPDSGYDIVVPSSYFVDRMQKQGMLQPLDKSKLPNFKHLNPEFLNKPFDLGNKYSVPYFWLATGIVYNDQYYLFSEVKHWQNFWDKRFENQLLLLDDMREVFGMALISLGYSVNETNPEHIKQAYLKLKTLMSNVKLFTAQAATSIYIDEDVTVGMGWSGDIYQAVRENNHLQFVYPDEGFVISLDSMVIPKYARHVNNAHIFINFILRPDIAKKITLGTGFATPNLTAIKNMAPNQLNPITFPNEIILSKGVYQTDLGEVNSLYEKYWELLKIGG